MTEDRPPFRDPRLPFDQRADDLLGRLTPDERVALLHQFTPAVERLGVAAFRTGQEALHGVAWMGPATVFPQAVGLGATWNGDLVRRVGEAVSREVRAMRARDERVGLNVWAPTVNLLRNPLWGRGEEGYSEDPALTSAIATAYTRGLRGDHPVYWRTAPVLKHWLAHNNETARDTSSASVRPRVLHEYDLRAFRATVEAGAVAGVMPAYNLVNGRPNHVSPHLRDHLRTWTDRPLLVCSDAGAPSNLADSQGYFATHEEATAAALRAGVDSFTDHGTDASTITARVRGALDRGLIGPADIDTAVRRQLHVRLVLGEFDPDLGPHAGTGAFDTPEHRALALEAAEQAVVLLANDGLLPLDPAAGQRVALVGPLADECKLDWYSGALLHRATPLDGLRERFGADRVTHAEGADLVRLHCATGTLRVPAAPAPAAEAGAAGTAPEADGALDPALVPGRTDLPPLTTAADAAGGTVFALTDWGGGVLTLRAPDGRYLSVADDGRVRASADQPGGWVVQETFRLEPHGDGHLLRHIGTGGHVSVAADGVKVAAGITGADGTTGADGLIGADGTSDTTGTSGTTGASGSAGAPAVFTVETVRRGVDEVTAAARAADVVVVVAGNDPHINGRETEDRTTLALPEAQDRLWRAARAANPRTVLVLASSYPYAVPDAAAELPALLWTAHGGQAAGTALARVLAGDVSPAGRLPQTWYADDADLPDLLDYDVIGGRQTYLYFDGRPLFPFGHGLTYTEFAYADLAVERRGDSVRVAFTVTNTGRVASDEVAQVYVRALAPSVPRPHRELVAHRRVRLAPGERGRLAFRVPLSALGFWDVAHGRWTVEPGPYAFLAGPSSADIRLEGGLRVEGPPPAPRPVPERGLAAADYDEQRGTVLADRTRESGDCVTPAGGGAGELLYRRCDFGPTGVRTAVLEVAGAGTVALSLADGTPLARAEAAVPDPPYTYAPLEIPLTATAVGVQDLRVTLRGGLRLAALHFTRPPG
ncbi:glycoside hydrolase family 3 C-terminal domain-containing protein [Streptomyces sp. enrichment culture]|uniref:glycoside hydrolase family 3 C-terminal domain-containing protein n=1 Tax=Streptomyces sp. enrichment culture TaxID=1795815 RepID=UPI003F54D3E2